MNRCVHPSSFLLGFMRIPKLLEYLAGGMTEAEILVDFPSLTQDDLREVLAFAALRERCLASIAA
jgi:uncharacterized protein (DUF433 family)